MKTLFLKKWSCLLLGVVLITSQLKAEDEKYDYTDLMTNPSFEYKGADDPVTATGLTAGTPYGWAFEAMKDGTPITDEASLISGYFDASYGFFNGARGRDGKYIFWMEPKKGGNLDYYSIYQDVTGLPAGEYLVSCRLAGAEKNRFATSQRFFVSTSVGNIVQYYGTEADYYSGESNNLTAGETNFFAGWEFGKQNYNNILKPMSIVVTVAEGETLRLGIKTGNLLPDGTRNVLTGGVAGAGAFRVDNFSIRKLPLPVDSNDYTHKIVNPSFELTKNGDTEVQITAIVDDSGSPKGYPGTPYGWLDEKEGLSGGYYAVNSDANQMDGTMVCCAEINDIEFKLYQNIENLPAGKYKVSCDMFVPKNNNRLTTQRLFANDNAVYYGKETDYSDNNLTAGETAIYAGWEAGETSESGRDLKAMSVEVSITKGQTLQLGLKTNKKNANGTTNGNGAAGSFKVDNFRLLLLEADPGENTDLNNVEKLSFDAVGQPDGVLLKLRGTKSAQVSIMSLTGQSVYTGMAGTETFIALPHGFYIVQAKVGDKQKTCKVAVK